MKNTSKNNFSEKKNKRNKKDNVSNFNSKNINSSKNNRFLSNKLENKLVNNVKRKDEKKRNYSSPTRPKIESYKEVSNKFLEIYKDPINKKNLDDWIWGKHAVYEALISERAINRVWCTSEIYSSEKFYILLKDHKLNGVLIEEVSWNRLSQLTFGASHQGIALQLASSKTISLDALIDFSKKILQIRLFWP